MNSQLLSFYYKLGESKSDICLYGNCECNNKAIKAHSVQNSFTFDILNDNGHVVCIKLRKNKQHIPSLEFLYTGRNVASTFTGLCKIHDNDIFEPIDNNTINLVV